MFNRISPSEVIPVLSNIILADGFKFTLDLEKSHGCYIYDSTNNREILDIFSYFATGALGHNHPKMNNDEEFKKNLMIAALANPSNSDFYTTQYANFADTFARIAMPKEFKHAFFISGGTLAVENGLKVAMDWKVKKNFAKGSSTEKGHQVIHFREAFHGRSGYCLSLTNTKPVNTDYFTKIEWPRILNPKIIFPLTPESIADVEARERTAIAQIKKAINDNPDDICAIIIEPIQSEGGDNHFRKEFFQQLRTIADENEIILMVDEVQNGVGLTGKFWAYQHYDFTPDILAFGKKMQICGIIATDRVDDVADNCFHVKGRINSTWGGNLADMVRATQIMRIIEEDDLVGNAAVQGAYLLKKLEDLQTRRQISNSRGRGLQCAFDLASADQRNDLMKRALEHNLLLLGAGERSIRFRPFLNVRKEDLDKAFVIIENVLKEMGL